MNGKSETRNPKFETSTKRQTAKKRPGHGCLVFADCCFGFVSSFGFRISCLLLVLMACGCIKKPVIALDDVKVEQFNFEQVDLAFEFKVYNPNSFQLSLSRLSYALASDGTQFARGSVPGPVVAVGSGETTVVRAPMTIRFAPLVAILTIRPRGESIPCDLVGEAGFNVYGQTVNVPFRRPGWMPVLRAPDWHFRGVELVRPAGRARPRVELLFDVDNPNSFAIPLAGLSGEVACTATRSILRVNPLRLEPPKPAAGPPGWSCRCGSTGRAAMAVLKAITTGERDRFRFTGTAGVGRARTYPGNAAGAAPMRYLITGGAGFIGSHLAEALLKAGHEVTVVDDLSTGSLDNIRHLLGRPGFQFVRDSVRNAATMTVLVDRCDVIFHLAAAVGVQLIVDRPVHTIETNIHGSEVVLGLANKFGRKIFVASTSRGVRQEHQGALPRGRRLAAGLDALHALELRVQQDGGRVPGAGLPRPVRPAGGRGAASSTPSARGRRGRTAWSCRGSCGRPCAASR